MNKQNPDGTWSAAFAFLGDGQHILAYGSPGGDASKPIEYWVSTDGHVWTTLPLTGPSAASVTSPETAGTYPPVLLRDGILFVHPDGGSLVGQAAAQ
jgi:hypothetical protein